MSAESFNGPRSAEPRPEISGGHPLPDTSESVPVFDPRTIASGGIFSDTEENRINLAKFLETKERSAMFANVLNEAIDRTRNFVRREYADGDIYTPKAGSYWTWHEGTERFTPHYGQDVIVRGQIIDDQDTHIVVRQYLEGEKPELGKIHPHGWSGVETIFDFQLLVRDTGSWVAYPSLPVSGETTKKKSA